MAGSLIATGAIIGGGMLVRNFAAPVASRAASHLWKVANIPKAFGLEADKRLSEKPSTGYQFGRGNPGFFAHSAAPTVQPNNSPKNAPTPDVEPLNIPRKG